MLYSTAMSILSQSQAKLSRCYIQKFDLKVPKQNFIQTPDILLYQRFNHSKILKLPAVSNYLETYSSVGLVDFCRCFVEPEGILIRLIHSQSINRQSRTASIHPLFYSYMSCKSKSLEVFRNTPISHDMLR